MNGTPGGAVVEFVILLILGLQIKHFIADYLLQFGWMISGKGSFSDVGGYVHAGFHIVGTAIVLLLGGVPLMMILLVLAGEFVIHYLLDFAKIHYSRNVSAQDQPHMFWALNGLDQMLHQMTYLGIAFIIYLWLPA